MAAPVSWIFLKDSEIQHQGTLEVAAPVNSHSHHTIAGKAHMHHMVSEIDLDWVIGGEDHWKIFESGIINCSVDGRTHPYADVVGVNLRLQWEV